MNAGDNSEVLKRHRAKKAVIKMGKTVENIIDHLLETSKLRQLGNGECEILRAAMQHAQDEEHASKIPEALRNQAKSIDNT